MMKKLLLTGVFAISCLYATAQLNPVSNLVYGDAYNYPAYSSCPGYNCFKLTWEKPVLSTTDTLKGYNIYRNDVLYTFVTDTFYGCQYINVCNPTAANWFNMMPFWITVKAVYNKDSITSIVTDSVYMGGEALGINKLNEKKLFSVSPNPFSTQTTLQTNEELKDATLIIYNSLGQQVKQIQNISGSTISLQRDNLSGGLYFIRLTQSNNTIALDKLVVLDN